LEVHLRLQKICKFLVDIWISALDLLHCVALPHQVLKPKPWQSLKQLQNVAKTAAKRIQKGSVASVIWVQIVSRGARKHKFRQPHWLSTQNMGPATTTTLCS